MVCSNYITLRLLATLASHPFLHVVIFIIPEEETGQTGTVVYPKSFSNGWPLNPPFLMVTTTW